MASYIKINNSWKESSNSYIKINNVWKGNNTAIFTKINGAWKDASSVSTILNDNE